MALPGYFDDEYESLTSNLAAVPVPPAGTPYRAYDGTPIGRSQSCEPISMEPMLSGWFEEQGLTPQALMPEALVENRIAVGEAWALPLLAAVVAYHQGAPALQTALWSLGAYMAPLPVAVLAAYQLAGYGRMQPAVGGLGQVWGPQTGATPKYVKRCAKYRRGPSGEYRCIRYKRVLGQRRERPSVRPGPWRLRRRCASYGYDSRGDYRCTRYKWVLPSAAYN